MALTRRRQPRRARSKAPDQPRYTIDASVFVNAFNPNEDGHAQSLALLTGIQQSADPVIVPVLLLPEVASAIGRATDDAAGALEYANATAALAHLTLIPLSPAMARQAAELAAAHRLRGADAVYIAVARRYGTSLVSRDEEQRKRGSAAVACLTPEEALAGRPAAPPASRKT